MSNYRDEREALAAENEVLKQEKAALQQQLSAAQQGLMTPPPARNFVAMGAVIAGAVVMMMGAGAALFVIRAPAAPPQVVAVALPPPVDPAPITISIAADNTVQVNGTPVVADGVVAALRAIAATQDASATRVTIAADRSVQYAKVVELMDAARSAGFTRISFLTGQQTQ